MKNMLSMTILIFLLKVGLIIYYYYLLNKYVENCFPFYFYFIFSGKRETFNRKDGIGTK